MAKIFYETFDQYPLGATNRGVNEYEFIQDSQVPPQISWPHPGDPNIFNDNLFSFDNGFEIVNNITPRIGTKSAKLFLKNKLEGTPTGEGWRAGRPRAELVRSSNAGLFSEQQWFKKRWYQVSMWFPSDWSSRFQYVYGDSSNTLELHLNIQLPFSASLPFSLRIQSAGTWQIINDNGYDQTHVRTNGPSILLDQWEDWLIEVIWDPFLAGQGPGGSGGTGYMKVWRNETLLLNAQKPQGTFQDYNAGNKPPFIDFGLYALPGVSASYYPASIYFGLVQVGDENETFQSMSPDAGAPNQKLAPLGFSPVPGTYPSPLSVTLTGINDVVGESPTTGASAFYSIDGAPFQAYGSISLTTPGGRTVNAYQSKTGFDDSDVTLASYTIEQQQASLPLKVESGVISGPITAGWSYDVGYSGNGVYAFTSSATILSVPSGYVAKLFQSIRAAAGISASLKYTLVVPNGELEIRVLLVEHNASISRRFKIKLQGEGTAGAWTHLGTEDTYTIIDPVAIVGRYGALVVTRPVTVVDGTITLDWEYDSPDASGMVCAGVEVLNLTSPDVPPATNVLIGTV